MKKNAITLGKIGILLPIASIIPYLGSLSGLASTVLLIISYNYFSQYYKESKIFNNYLTGFLVAIGSGLIGMFMFMFFLGATFRDIIFRTTDFKNLLDLFAYSWAKIVASLAVIYVGYIISKYFQYLAKKELALRTQVKEFSTSGLLNFIGSIAIILAGLGLIVMFVGWIFEIVAYFNVKEENQDEINQYSN